MEMSFESREKMRPRDDLSILDSIHMGAAAEAIAFPGSLSIANEILKDIEHSDAAKGMRADPPPEGATSFDEMMDTSIGTSWQRLQKWYFGVGDAKKSMEFFESIGVDKYRKTVRWLVLDLLKRRQIDEQLMRDGKNTNYLLRDTSLPSLLDFATNKSTLNESVHLFGAAFTALVGTASTMTAESPLEMSAAGGATAAFFLLNLYSIFAQRYTRSQLKLAIDTLLERGGDFDREKYENSLGIRLPGTQR